MNVIITGASRGIGKAIAETFASHGHKLFLTALNEERLAKTIQEVRGKFPQSSVAGKAFDISKKNQAIEFGKWCLSQGSPDVLVNNAGSFAGGSVHIEEDGALETMIETNLYSAYHLSRAVLPEMMRNRRGHIFNMSSIAGLQAYKNGGAYSISKFALRGFSMNLREELKPYKIKVTTVYPGAVYTDSWKNQVSSERIMQSQDIADMIFAAAQLSPQACVEDIIMRPQPGDL